MSDIDHFELKKAKQLDLENRFASMLNQEKRFDSDGKVEILTNDELETLEEYLLDIQVIGEYDGEDDTPLDWFDTECHM